MAFTQQSNFIAELDGTTVSQLNKKLDYSKINLKERKEVVEQILSNTNFFAEYFSNHFKGKLVGNDHLSESVNVCRSLEAMASYLLNSKEIKDSEDSEVQKYIFHTDSKYFQKKIDREQSLAQETNGQEENVIHFFKKATSNYKKEKAQTLSTKDIKPTNKNSQADVEYVKEILEDYQNFLNHLTKELSNKNSKYNRYYLTNAKGQVIRDMIYCKDQLLGIWGYDLQNFYESTVPNLDVFDFTNPTHLKGKKITFVNDKGEEHTLEAKGLLFLENNHDPSNDMSLVLWDLQNTINKAGLTPVEKYILEATRKGLTQDEIAFNLGWYQAKVSRTIDIIVKKVVKVGNKYDRQS